MTQTPSPPALTLNRALIGTIAATLLLGAGILWYFVGQQNIWTGACLKVGLVMAAFWLALPMISRRAQWGEISPGGVIGLVALALVLTGKRVDTRIVIPLLAGAAIMMVILRPRPRRK